MPVGLAVGAADQAPRACDSAHGLTGKERAISRLVAPGSRVTSEPDPTTVSRSAPFIRSEPCVCRRVRGWDLEFESGLLQRGVCKPSVPLWAFRPAKRVKRRLPLRGPARYRRRPHRRIQGCGGFAPTGLLHRLPLRARSTVRCPTRPDRPDRLPEVCGRTSANLSASSSNSRPDQRRADVAGRANHPAGRNRRSAK